MIDALNNSDGEPLMRTLLTQRNGTRDKVVTTGVGDVGVKIAKLRSGSLFPALLEPRRSIDIALHAVIMQAYIEGVSDAAGRRHRRSDGRRQCVPGHGDRHQRH